MAPAQSPPRLLITPGEPAGIGPDLCVRLVQDPPEAELVAVADPNVLRARARHLGMPLELRELDPAAEPSVQGPGNLRLLAVTAPRPVECGRLEPKNAAYVLETLRVAAQHCRRGEADALVTGPVHKGVINDAGFPFTGHTEFLAELCGVRDVVMMLTAPGLRVALVTTHIPLAQVAGAISTRRVEISVRILDAELQTRMGVAHPRIVVCGLNPHAGEGGHLGREEIDIIQPALAVLRREGYDLLGPLPADTAFTRKYLDQADAVLCMYHDQGLPVLKHTGFGEAVNVTLGLPIIRTSVDHGTALELAGTEAVDAGSMRAAVDAACSMVHQARKTRGARAMRGNTAGQPQ